MKTISHFFVILITVTMFSTIAFAEEKSAAGVGRLKNTDKQKNCVMQETANVSVSFNGQESDMTKVKVKIDQKIESARALGSEAGLESVELQNYSYNVYSNNNGGGGCCGDNCSGGNQTFNMNGSFSFVVKPIDKAPDFAALLTKHGYNTNFNVNAYNNCNGYAD